MGRPMIVMPAAPRSVPMPSAPAPGERPTIALPEREAPPTWKEFFIYSANFTGAQALAAGTLNGAPGVQAFSEFDIRISSDSDFEFLKTVYVFTDPRVYLRMFDTTAGRLIQRGTLDARLVAGTGISTFSPTPAESFAFLPFIWPQGHIIPAASVYAVQAADFSGAPNTVRFSFHGSLVRPGRAPWLFDPDGRPKRYRTRLPYTYAIPPDANVTPLAASATLQSATPIDMEADFLCTAITAQAQGAYTVLIEDAAGRERRWMDTAVHVQNLAGNGLLPMRLTAPRFFYRGGSILVTVSDLSALSNRWRLFFHGVKLYEQ